MKDQQFETLANLARMRESKAKQAAKRYMLNGERQTAIAADLGISQPTISRAVANLWRVYRKTRDLI